MHEAGQEPIVGGVGRSGSRACGEISSSVVSRDRDERARTSFTREGSNCPSVLASITLCASKRAQS